MRIKEGFILRRVADTWVVLAVGDNALDFSGMLTINTSGKLLWELLVNGTTQEDLVNALTTTYFVTYEEAKKDVHAFLDILKKAGCLE